jgi:hypothetical protein
LPSQPNYITENIPLRLTKAFSQSLSVVSRCKLDNFLDDITCIFVDGKKDKVVQENFLNSAFVFF